MYDVIVVGGGHAGVEASLASSRIGMKTLLITLTKENIASMPCNPSIGGPAKGVIVREIDARGGQMAINTDKTYLYDYTKCVLRRSSKQVMKVFKIMLKYGTIAQVNS